MLDAEKIGQDRIQNPEELFRRTQGAYADAVGQLSSDQRYPNTPRPPERSPFGVLSAPTGPGRGGI